MAVGTCHRPLSGITGHSYCPFKSIVWLSCIVSYRHYLRSKAIVDCYLGCRNLSPPIIMDSRSFVLSLAPAVDAVQHCCYLVFSARNSIAYELITPGYTCCARLSDLVFAVVEDIVSAAPCCQNWHPPVLGSQPIVLSCVRTVSEIRLWCYEWSQRRRCSWVRIDRSHWVGHSIYCLGHRLTSRLRFRLCGRPATATIIVYGGCVRTGAFRGPALCAPSSCLLLLCLGISIMIPRVRLWPGDGILLIETPEFITWANHKEPYR